MAMREKQVVTLKVAGACETHARTRVSARDVHSVVDEPTARGGTNEGPTPTETMLASLAGCTNVITHKIAAARGIEIGDMNVTVEARFDRGGVTLAEEVAVPFPSMVMTVDLRTDADAATMRAVREDLTKFCPISKVIRAAGTTIEEVWNVSPP